MAQFFNYDPLTGVTEHFDYDEETGVASIIHSQDVSAALEQTKALANTGATDSGIKRGLWHYASLPAIVQIKLRSMGIDIHSKDPGMQNRMLRAIDEHFPQFKTTMKRHRVQNKRHV